MRGTQQAEQAHNNNGVDGANILRSGCCCEQTNASAHEWASERGKERRSGAMFKCSRDTSTKSHRSLPPPWGKESCLFLMDPNFSVLLPMWDVKKPREVAKHFTKQNKTKCFSKSSILIIYGMEMSKYCLKPSLSYAWLSNIISQPHHPKCFLSNGKDTFLCNTQFVWNRISLYLSGTQFSQGTKY